MDNPAAHWLRGRRLVQFLGNCFGNEDLGVKRWEEIRLADQDQIAKRRGIGDHDARH